MTDKTFKDTWLYAALIRIYNAMFAAFLWALKKAKQVLQYFFG